MCLTNSHYEEDPGLRVPSSLSNLIPFESVILDSHAIDRYTLYRHDLVFWAQESSSGRQVRHEDEEDDRPCYADAPKDDEA